MKILHCCLANFYIDDYGYQENILSRINKLDGHDVRILASTETYGDNKSLAHVEPSSYMNGDGIEVTRIPYRKFFPHSIMKRLRYYVGVKEYIESFNPDVILYHGNGGHGIVEVASYVSQHPETRLYVDSHEDFGNSARGLLSRYILHRTLGRMWLRLAMPQISKMLYICPECVPFLKEMYEIPDDKLELYPLGGVIFEEDILLELRRKWRNKLAFNAADIVALHSGKLSSTKKTRLLLDAWNLLPGDRYKLVIVGTCAEDALYNDIQAAMRRDERIIYLGWQSASDLKKIMCASDIYLQPGTVSASFQEAMCSSCAMVAADSDRYRLLFGDIPWYFPAEGDISIFLRSILSDRALMESKRSAAFEYAKAKLDYRVLASRIYE